MEVFSSDVKVKCRNCGFVVFNDLQSCIEWCKYAEKCVGEDLVRQMKGAAKQKRKKEQGKKAEGKAAGKKK